MARASLRDVRVRPQALGDLPADGEDRVERGRRLLEHHRDVGPAQLPQLRLRHRDDVGSAVPVLGEQDDRAARRRRLGQQAEDGLGRDGLAAAGLADDRRAPRPARDRRLTPATALTAPASLANETSRSRMSTTPGPRLDARSSVLFGRSAVFAAGVCPQAPASSGAARDDRRGGHGAGRRADPAPAPQPRVGQVVEALADQRDAEHDEHDRQARGDAGPPDAAGARRRAPVEVVAPLGGRGRLDAEAEEAEARRASAGPRRR